MDQAQNPQQRQERTPRDLQTRKEEVRYEYKPAATLPEPRQDPNFAYRWVATHTMGQLDPVNASLRFRDGWEPCKVADHPELFLPAGKDGNVEVGGLMLCRMPKERALARQRYYEAQTQAQVASVDNTYMKQQDARMPMFADKRSEVSRGSAFGTGNARKE